VASIIEIDLVVSVISSWFIIHDLIVSTTSHHAKIAPDASAIAANIIAHVNVNALLQTAGHILFATSFAQRFAAIYIQNTVAIRRYNLSVAD